MADKARSGAAANGLRAVLKTEPWHRLADSRTIARGAAYASGGRVRTIQSDDNTITANVRGQSKYHVELTCHDGVLSGSCTCPMGNDGVFCKHCVAVAISAAGDGSSPAPVDLRTPDGDGSRAPRRARHRVG